MADDSTPAFFKILLNPMDPHLPLPPAFVKKHLKNKIPKNPRLESAKGGHSWELKIEEVGETCCFTHGWSKVVQDAHLGYGYFLVFRLVQPSIFKVSIFSPNGCERHLPPSIINIQDDDDDDDDDGDPFFKTTISKTHNHLLRLPSKFVGMAGIGGRKTITMKNVDNEEWELGLRSENNDGTGRRYLSSGWHEFRRNNAFSDGDECLCKYIKKEGKLCLVKVSKKNPPAKAKTPVTEVVKRKRGRPRKAV